MIPSGWRSGEVAVIGLGRSGIAAAQWLVRQGVAVYGSDLADTPVLRAAAATLSHDGVAVDVGRHDLDRIRRAVAVVVSPGVPPDAPALKAARSARREIVAELDLAVRALESVRLVVVTGTNGKSTTTALIAHLLQTAGLRAEAAGNIGRPLIDVAREPTLPDWIAVEASSFQLHDAPHLAPAVGVVTNLAPDHLDRYPDAKAYYADKRLLFRNATADSVWVLNGDDDAVLALARGVPGTRRHFRIGAEADAWFDRVGEYLMVEDEPVLRRDELPLLGEHNVANALAAALAARATGVETSSLAGGLRTFQPLAHRLEPVAETDGVRWVNDSKATNVTAAIRAVQAMTGPFILIVGGHHKGERYEPLAQALSKHCRAVVAYGAAGHLVAPALAASGAPVETVQRFDEAVRRAGELATSGTTVLLAPACASYDQFANFEERGARFRALVEERCTC